MKILEGVRSNNRVKVPLDQGNFDQHQSKVSVLTILLAMYTVCIRGGGEELERVWGAGWDSFVHEGSLVILGRVTFALRNGVASGWRWTGLLDTLLNIASFKSVVYFVEQAWGIPVTYYNNCHQGDDVTFEADNMVAVQALVDMYGLCGYEVNPAKTYFPRDRTEFLRRSYEKVGIVGYLPRSLCRIMYRNLQEANPVKGENLHSRLSMWTLAHLRGAQSLGAAELFLEDARQCGVEPSVAADFALTPNAVGGAGLLEIGHGMAACLRRHGTGKWLVPRVTKEEKKVSFPLQMWGNRLQKAGICLDGEEMAGFQSSLAASWGVSRNLLFGPEFGRKVFCYIDDIIIISETFDEHISLLDRIFERLKNSGLTINLSKSKFCKSELKYLGYVIDRDGLRTDPLKIECVRQYPRPKTVKEVRSFVGLCSYYRKFIKNFSTISAPITKLTSGEVTSKTEVAWNDEAEIAFRDLKEALITAPVLKTPNFESPFFLHCDASGYGIGSALVQKDEQGKEHPVAYYSRTLSKNERNFSTTERELLAVVESVEHFKHYLEGSHFTVVTDHSSLKWLTKLENPSGRLARWATLNTTMRRSSPHCT